MALKLAAKTEHPSNIIESFARSQLEQVDRGLISDSTFLILATCAFFFGAEKQLRKQSGIPSYLSKTTLIEVLITLCGISERNACGITKAINRLSEKYYLIENIVETGEQAADQWLCCETIPSDSLRDLTQKYKGLSMFDLGIEGINEEHESGQQQLYSAVYQTVGDIRHRMFIVLTALLALLLGVGIILFILIQ